MPTGDGATCWLFPGPPTHRPRLRCVGRAVPSTVLAILAFAAPNEILPGRVAHASNQVLSAQRAVKPIVQLALGAAGNGGGDEHKYRPNNPPSPRELVLGCEDKAMAMRAALCTDYGNVDEVLTVVEDAPRPTFEPAGKASRGRALIRVKATALAPGDVRVLSGRTREIQGPPSLPYVPGGADLCGVVEATADGEKYLKVGDTVVSQFDQNWGGLAEFALAKSSNCARAPPSRLSPAEAAATASSGASAVVISRHVKSGDRVLVIGGSGGVGTFLVQLARAKGASFVAAVSTQTELMRELGADKAIDYREEDVWASAEFQGKGGQFDVVFDLVEKGWDRVTSPEGRARPIVKTGWKGGRFVTTVPPYGKWFDGHSVWQISSVFIFPVLGKVVSTLLWPWGRPRYKFAFGLGIDAKRTQFTELFDLIEAGTVKVVLDGGSPRAFTTEDVRAAFKLQESGHAHGKVVVQIAE